MTDRLRQDQRRAAARRRTFVRRRLAAAAALALVVAAVGGLIVALDSGGGTQAATGAKNAGKRKQRGKGESEESGPVRNADPQPDWEPHTGPVPILEYHELGDAPADAPYPELYVSRSDFHRQLHWLDSHGYQAVTLEQVEAAWYDGATLPPRPVVISFDDGYRPQFTFALPQLREHGWAGVLNLKAEGSDLYDSNVEAMLAAGWELASHTIDHSDLTTLEAEALTREVTESRQILRREYGAPVANFCYPAGEFDATVIEAVAAAGYVGATTEIRGEADSARPYELDRYEILGSDGVERLAAILG